MPFNPNSTSNSLNPSTSSRSVLVLVLVVLVPPTPVLASSMILPGLLPSTLPVLLLPASRSSPATRKGSLLVSSYPPQAQSSSSSARCSSPDVVLLSISISVSVSVSISSVVVGGRAAISVSWSVAGGRRSAGTLGVGPVLARSTSVVATWSGPVVDSGRWRSSVRMVTVSIACGSLAEDV